MLLITINDGVSKYSWFFVVGLLFFFSFPICARIGYFFYSNIFSGLLQAERKHLKQYSYFISSCFVVLLSLNEFLSNIFKDLYWESLPLVMEKAQLDQHKQLKNIKLNVFLLLVSSVTATDMTTQTEFLQWLQIQKELPELSQHHFL